jgi:hypothetical protein
MVSGAYPLQELSVRYTKAMNAMMSKHSGHSCQRPQVLLFDRGYPSYDLIRYWPESSEHHAFVFRCSAQSTFKAVEHWLRSGQPEALIWLDCASKMESRQATKSIQLRVLRLESPDGTLPVLITNLLNRVLYPSTALLELYFRRWRIDEQYRDEKTHLAIETFHSHSENGVKQELLAVLVRCVISRTLMVLVTEQKPTRRHTPQFKNTLRALAMDAALLTADNPEVALRILLELLKEIARVKYYPPKQPRKSYPGVSRKPVNKWQLDKASRMANA